MSSWLTSWIAALRISRREALRNKSRNILIIAMLMLPVLAVTALETVWNSASDLSTQEKLTRVVGTAEAWITRDSTQAIQQSTGLPTMSLPANWGQQVATGNYSSAQTSNAQGSDAGGIRAVLPSATVLPETSVWGVFMRGPAGYASPQFTNVDLTKPQLAGAFDLLSGRVPETATEVDLTPRTMKEFGAQIGSTITMPASVSLSGKAATFTVVGEMYQPGSTNADQLFALPTAADPTGENPQGWFVLNPGGVSWSQVQAMNKSGYLVTSREVALDPPPASQVPYDALQTIMSPGSATVDAAEAAVLAIAVGIALLEVVLLAGPAFAVSARSREREYAIIGAAGASGSHLRRIVLADGLLLGAIAGVAGAGLGFGAGAAVLPWLGHLGSLPGHVHVDVLRVVGVAVLAMLLGLCAAWMPARAVARRDIFATLSGRRVATSRRVQTGRVVKGVVLIALGACAVFLDRKLSPGAGAVYIVAGIALIEVGGILCTPAVISGMAKLGRILPLGPRLALRDSARHTGRTTPAVAAMFAAVAGAVAAGAWLDSSLTQGRDTYEPSLMSNQVGLPNVASQKQATQMVAKLSTIMPITGSTVVTEINAFNTSDTNQYSLSALPTSDPGQCTPGTVTQAGTLSALAQFQGCGMQMFGTEMALDPIGGPATLKNLTGIDDADADADAALNNGGAVVFTPGIVQNGKVTLVFQHAFADKKTKPGTAAETTETTTYFTAPAVYENPQGIPNPGIVISPALAQRMGAATGGTESLVINLSSHITAKQQYAATQALNGFGLQGGLTVEGGYISQLGLANLAVLAVALLLAIGAAAIATGLALADGRADQETLTAVGGSPWTRRWLAGSTALVITGLGIVIGVPLGFVISEGLVRVSNLGLVGPGPGAQKVFVVPWLNLGVLVIAVPVLTALGAMALARSKAPRIRRIEF
jgi:putative ABC transport system permease protein